mgnify:CR=1 FL=1
MNQFSRNSALTILCILTIILASIFNINITTNADANASPETAQYIATNGINYSGNITNTENKIYYKFILNSNSRLRINFKAYFDLSCYYVYDADYHLVYSQTYNDCNRNTQLYNDTSYVDLNRGTYYFCVANGSSQMGKYEFSLNISAKTLSLNKSEIYMYKNKSYTLKPTTTPATKEKIKWTISDNSVATVNSKGVVYSKRAGSTVIKAVVGNKVTATCTVYIKPDTCKILKIKSGALVNKRRRTVVVYWQKLSDISGYNVYYSTSRYGKYKKADYYFLIDTWNHRDYKLKRHKTYYFKMRAFKYEGRKTLYGNYSSVKKIRVK